MALAKTKVVCQKMKRGFSLLKEKCYLVPAFGLIVSTALPPGVRIEKNNGSYGIVNARFASCIYTRTFLGAANKSDPLIRGFQNTHRLGQRWKRNGKDSSSSSWVQSVWIIHSILQSQTLANTSTNTVRTHSQGVLLSLLLLIDDVTTCQEMRHPGWIYQQALRYLEIIHREQVLISKNNRARVW